jgi:predicted Zn-dependent protease with MMP-like domain
VMSGLDDSAPGFDPVHNERDFWQLVKAAVDELPDYVRKELENVAILVSDDGARQRLYGLYRGIHAANRGRQFALPSPPDQITIFRDTIVRDFGHDPELLREQVRTTVRHEVGHHLGMDEDTVRRLGL